MALLPLPTGLAADNVVNKLLLSVWEFGYLNPDQLNKLVFTWDLFTFFFLAYHAFHRVLCFSHGSFSLY